MGSEMCIRDRYDGATDDIEEPAHPYVSQDDPIEEEECESCVL